MQQATGFVQQAITAFYTRHFTKAVYLLRRALQALPNVWPYPQSLHWILLDLLEMVESWYQGLPMLEASAYSQELLQELRQWLEQEGEEEQEQKDRQAKLTALDQLLEGLWVGFDFFDNNNLSVEINPPLIALQIEANGQIQLYKCQEHVLVDQLIAEFNACFELQLENPVAYEAALLPLLEQKQWGEAFERVERLRDYSARLLKPDEYYRILQFCRLLQQLAKAHFDYDKIGVHLKYLERLETQSMHYRGGINELEIIPYQHLWDIVLRLSRQQVAEQ